MTTDMINGFMNVSRLKALNKQFISDARHVGSVFHTVIDLEHILT